MVSLKLVRLSKHFNANVRLSRDQPPIPKERVSVGEDPRLHMVFHLQFAGEFRSVGLGAGRQVKPQGSFLWSLRIAG